MSELVPSIFVISNPQDRNEILAPLMEAGFREILAGEGSDETLSFYERLRPDVVVLCANLDHGDARPLIAAMREGAHGRMVRIVLIGDVHGPIRNALDVADLAVDRFLGRPLSPKALVFCVRTCAEAAMAARMAEAGGDEPEIEIEAGSEADDDEPEIEIEVASEADEDEPEIEGMAAAQIDAGPASGWEDPGTPAWREPTVILPDGGAEPLDMNASQPEPPVNDEPVRLVDDFSGGLDEEGIGEGIGDDLDEGLDEEYLASASELDAHIADLDGGAEGGGEFARELRRKMSAMAERLFPGQGAGAAAGPMTPAPMAHEPDAAGVPGDVPDDVPDEALDEVMDGPMVDSGPIRHGQADAVILFERVYRQRFSGRITFRREHARKSILFENGRPVFASSNLPEDRLGALLSREGKITGTQHGQAYLRAIESGKRMAEALVEMGYLKRRELLPTVRRHLEDVIYSVFAWDAGEYEVIEGSFAAGERIRLSRHPAAMIMEGVRRKLDKDTLAALVGAPATVVEIADDRQLKTVVSVADLSSAERKVVASFDGERTIDAIARRAGLGLVAVYQLAYGLIVMQAAQVVRRVDQGTGAPHADHEDEVLIDRQRVLAKLSLVGEADYFALLGVRRDATSFEIQRAYEAAQRDYGSEMFCPEVRRALEVEIAEINDMIEEAYRVLRDDALRSAYLSHLRD